MIKTKKAPTGEEIASTIVEGILEKKGKDVRRLDLRNLENAMAEYMVICHGDSDRQVAAIADSVEEFMFKTHHEKPSLTEGKSEGEWILIDFFNVIVHIFKAEKRAFYGVEELWGDAEIKNYQSA